MGPTSQFSNLKAPSLLEIFVVMYTVTANCMHLVAEPLARGRLMDVAEEVLDSNLPV